MKKELYEQIENVFGQKLSAELDGLSSIGKKAPGAKNIQFALNAQIEFEEMVRIFPEKPLFKPGVLLTSQKSLPRGPIDSQATFSNKIKTVNGESGVDYAFIDTGNIRDISELGFFKKVLIPETILVAQEFIEIKKRVHSVTNKGNQISKNSMTKIYEVQHLLEVINDKEKMFIPTKMFIEDIDRYGSLPIEEVYASPLIFEGEIDIDLIEHIYKSADPEKIILPLEILKEEK